MSSLSTTQTFIRLAIIGAGPAGLALARLLHVSIPSLPSNVQLHVSVFDLDTSASARSQGGTLDIHPESGYRLIEAAGLLDVFKRIVRPEGDTM